MTDWIGVDMSERTCTVEGCEGKHRGRGLCRLHYQRVWKRGSTDLPSMPSPAERLAAGLERKPNGCLEWTGSTVAAGYGRIWFRGKLVATHRLAWTLVNGPILDGLNILHRCDNPPCCDPTHLRVGTQAENVADMAMKGRRRGFASQI